MKTRVIWLKIGAAVTVISGLLISGSVVVGPLASFLDSAVDLVFLPIDNLQSTDQEATRLLSAITGGLLVGLGVLLWIVATDVLPDSPQLGRKMILASIGSWFLVDSSMSLAAGAPLNALINLGFLAIFVLPVLGISRSKP